MSLVRQRIEPGIEVLRLDRPETRNAFDRALLAELIAALETLAGDQDLRALIFSTTDTIALSAGADVSEVLSVEQGVARMAAFSALYEAIEAFPAPTIAVCVGNVIGAGAELAVGCDLRVGGDNLKIGWVGARLGVPVGPARLVPVVGVARAKELLFTGRVLGMEVAERFGLLHRTAPADQAEAVALGLAGEIAGNSLPGVRALKAMVAEAQGSAERVRQENRGLEHWQQHGSGLPQGG
ncbi:MAG: enoyl-CoA hydratase/isomerase family protein [Actinomycetota bacterium]